MAKGKTLKKGVKAAAKSAEGFFTGGARPGLAVAGKITGGVGAGLTADWLIGQGLSALDDEVTRAKQSADNAEENAILKGYSERTRQLRSQVAALSPVQQIQYAQELKGLLQQRTVSRSENAMFNAHQVAALMQAALNRTQGTVNTPEGRQVEAEVQRLQAGNAISAENRGLGRNEEKYRGSFWGTAMGLASGRTDVTGLNKWGKGAAKVAKFLMHPQETLLGENEIPIDQPKIPGSLSREVPGTTAFGPSAKISVAGPVGVEKAENSQASSPESFRSKGAATLEDYIKAALRGAGFGSPEAQAYHYDPWGQTGGTAPYQAALTGSYDALNPRIAGGQAPTIKDVQRLHTGTQQSQQAYADALRAQGQAMAQRAADAGIAGYAAMQQGEGLRAGMMAKDKASQEKNLINFYTRANSDITRREAINSQNPDANLAKQLAEERANLEADFFNRREALGMSGEEFQE
jgi:hypothetical protein